MHKRKPELNAPAIFILMFYFIPNSLPNLFLRPFLVVGIPIAFATFLFADVTPNARFKLKDKPGIADFLAIRISPFLILSSFQH